MANTKIYRGDTVLFQFALKDATGAAFDLTDYLAYFAAKAKDASEYQFNAQMTITNIVGGLCEYRLTETNSGTAGIYTAEVEIRNVSLTRVLTMGQFQLEIIDDVRKSPWP